jgi:molecular chaperone DnaK
VNYPLGVDVGTTYTAAALWRQGRVQTVSLGNRADAIPSVLFAREDGTLLVGEAAARRGIAEPDRQASEFKRRMGDDVPILVGGRGFSAPELTGRVLAWVVERVSEAQGGPPSHVVLTCPASWGEFRRGLLTSAAMAAGLRNVGLLAEPVAAATWYAAQERVEPGSLIGIYDFGGGTFDASVVRKTPTGMEIFGEPGGDDSIGGIDFDHALFRHVLTAAGLAPGSYDETDPSMASALAQLLAGVVDAKEALSADTEVVVPVVLPGVTRQVLITRADFEDLIRAKVAGTVGVFEQVVRRAGVDPAALHAVLLVGGSSRIPLVGRLLARELGIRVALDAHPKYTVSLGAAIAAAPRVAAPPGFPAPPRFSPPPDGAPGRRPQMYPQPVRPPAPPVPAVAERVDLAGTGLTAPSDVPVVLSAVPVAPPGRTGDRVAVVRTGRAPFTRGRFTAVLIVVVIAGVVAVIALVLSRGGKNQGGTGVPSRPSITVPDAAPPAGTVRVTGSLVAGPTGPDTMRSVAALPSGDLVAVGVSLHLLPRAWVRHGNGPWTAVPQPPADHQATMADVAATPSGAVAVGWTGVGATRRAAVWTSGDGRTWRLLPPVGDFAPGTGIVALTALTLTGHGTLLAVGADRKSDPTDGDVAVYTSATGTAWTKAPATGLSGTGPQTVQRLARMADGRLVAVGSALTGAHEGPAVWTSADGGTWQSASAPDDGSVTLLGVVAQTDGSLLACGSVGSADQPSVGCWTAGQGGSWQQYTVTGSPAPLYMYGLLRTSGGVLMVGAARSGTTVDAAAWSATVAAH